MYIFIFQFLGSICSNSTVSRINAMWGNCHKFSCKVSLSVCRVHFILSFVVGSITPGDSRCNLSRRCDASWKRLQKAKVGENPKQFLQQWQKLVSKHFPLYCDVHTAAHTAVLQTTCETIKLQRNCSFLIVRFQSFQHREKLRTSP